MVGLRVAVTGIDAIEAAMLKENRVRLQRIKAAGNEAKRVLMRAMRAAAPVASGNLKRSIGGDVWVERETVYIDVGPEVRRRGAHAHLIEFGTNTRSTNAGANRGRVAATHWAATAVEANEDAVFDLIGQAVAVW